MSCSGCSISNWLNVAVISLKFPNTLKMTCYLLRILILLTSLSVTFRYEDSYPEDMPAGAHIMVVSASYSDDYTRTITYSLIRDSFGNWLIINWFHWWVLHVEFGMWIKLVSTQQTCWQLESDQFPLPKSIKMDLQSCLIISNMPFCVTLLNWCLDYNFHW